jgi:capsular polysaccharide biosynthesis protein
MAGGRRAHRRWWIVLIVAVAGLVAGAAIGATRRHTYSSTATMSAGPITALTSAQAANESSNIIMASDYAQLISTDTVARRVAARLHTSVGYVSSHLSATAETGTALFDITGRGSTAAAATALTAAATYSFRDYIENLVSNQRTQPQLLSQYQQASRSSQSLKARIAQLQARLSANSDNATMQRLQSQLAVAQLRVQGLASLFIEGDQIVSVSQDATPTIVAAPQAATSTVKKKTAEYAAVGLLAGLCLGISLVVLPGAVLPPGSTPRRTDDVSLGPV